MDPKKIFQSLREQIVWLDLKPESYLNLTELAEVFGVSRTPIKEVLTLLQAEGWVLRHGSHFMVTPLSLGRIKEITEIRTILEIQANLWAMERITADELSALGELKTEILGLGDGSANRQIVELDVAFHRLLFKATKNSQLAQLLDQLLIHYLRFWLSIPREIEPRSFFFEALEIIRAVEAKDRDGLRAASAEHIKKSMDEIMGTF
jgi:DNA-binding GntR family transcriptional regulator